MNEGEREEDEIVVESCSLLQSKFLAVHSCSTGESVKTLTVFRNEVQEQLFPDFLVQNPRQKVGNYVEGSVMSIAMLDA